jgi:hypothetical protein
MDSLSNNRNDRKQIPSVGEKSFVCTPAPWHVGIRAGAL